MFASAFINASSLVAALLGLLCLTGSCSRLPGGVPVNALDDGQRLMMKYSPMDDNEPRPSPALSPEQVVGIQLQALQRNDDPVKDNGIAIAFRFASPANQAATGPLENFILLVKNPLYKPMLNHRTAERGPMKIDGDEAEQRVTLTSAAGEKVVYIFTLSKQREGQFKDCWMTDGVVRLRGEASLKGEQVASGNGHLKHFGPA